MCLFIGFLARPELVRLSLLRHPPKLRGHIIVPPLLLLTLDFQSRGLSSPCDRCHPLLADPLCNWASNQAVVDHLGVLKAPRISSLSKALAILSGSYHSIQNW